VLKKLQLEKTCPARGRISRIDLDHRLRRYTAGSAFRSARSAPDYGIGRIRHDHPEILTPPALDRNSSFG